MAGIGPIRQDWEPVVVRKKAPTAAAKKDEKAVNAARRSGAEIETMKKYNAGMNKAASSGTSLNTKRLDDDTENLALHMIITVYESDVKSVHPLQRVGACFTMVIASAFIYDAGVGDERVPSDLKKNLMQARLDKKLTQAQLAQMINEKPQVIQEYESGKAIPNQQIIGKLERALGTKLRGKK
ncbi:Multiprotein-bridging factor 1b [Zea mays]|uniref:Multiprotein-bridging factor 1b n=1 Tax=Zea mays TaxID=4577 RepID=A0A3L6F8E9_MAIZE|nr:Multiprotein-bridging factor 1b [Zea mays]